MSARRSERGRGQDREREREAILLRAASLDPETFDRRQALSQNKYKEACLNYLEPDQWAYNDITKVEDDQVAVLDYATRDLIEKNDIVVLSDGNCYSKASISNQIDAGVVDHRSGRVKLPYRQGSLLSDLDYALVGRNPPVEGTREMTVARQRTATIIHESYAGESGDDNEEEEEDSEEEGGEDDEEFGRLLLGAYNSSFGSIDGVFSDLRDLNRARRMGREVLSEDARHHYEDKVRLLSTFIDGMRTGPGRDITPEIAASINRVATRNLNKSLGEIMKQPIHDDDEKRMYPIVFVAILIDEVPRANEIITNIQEHRSAQIDLVGSVLVASLRLSRFDIFVDYLTRYLEWYDSADYLSRFGMVDELGRLFDEQRSDRVEYIMEKIRLIGAQHPDWQIPPITNRLLDCIVTEDCWREEERKEWATDKWMRYIDYYKSGGATPKKVDFATLLGSYGLEASERPFDAFLSKISDLGSRRIIVEHYVRALPGVSSDERRAIYMQKVGPDRDERREQRREREQRERRRQTLQRLGRG